MLFDSVHGDWHKVDDYTSNWFTAHLTLSGIGHSRLCRKVRGQGTPERPDKIIKPKGLANETADLRSVQHRSCCLLAISACQNYLYVWTGLHCLGKYFLTESTRNRHVQQDRVNLPGVSMQKLDCL